MKAETIDLAGISFENRQATYRSLANMVVKIPVMAVRRKDNPGDYNAIEILTMQGDSLGYIPRGLAAEYAPLMDRGLQLPVTFNKISRNGGNWYHAFVDVAEISHRVIDALPKIPTNPTVINKVGVTPEQITYFDKLGEMITNLHSGNEQRKSLIENITNDIRTGFKFLEKAQSDLEKLSKL